MIFLEISLYVVVIYRGEFCDGEGTTVYNELYRWNIERNEWKMVESLNTPPPRCSHQAVYFKVNIYIYISLLLPSSVTLYYIDMSLIGITWSLDCWW